MHLIQIKEPNKARAFKSALGYTKDNADELINSINEHFDVTKLEERGDGGYGNEEPTNHEIKRS